MRQLFLLVLLFFAGRWLVRTLRAADAPGAQRGGAARRESSPGRGGQTRSLAEPVVRCVSCGVHAPKSESVFVGGQYFCCNDHAVRYAARTAGPR